MRQIQVAILALLLLGLAGVAEAAPSPANPSETAVVHAVLFWAEGCSHCEYVMGEVLPPLQAQYGSRLDVQMIEISAPARYQYFRELEDQYQVPADLRGTPALFLGDRLLVGEQQIPDALPGLIEYYLQSGGVDFPNLPGLAEYLPATAATGVLCTASTPCAQPDLLAVKFGALAALPAAQDAAAANNGFGLARAIMALMILSLLYVLASSVLAGRNITWLLLPSWLDNLLPVLAVAGLGVALYLTYVETGQVAAVCGPIGDCNSVQASPYAHLFGILPVGLLGAAGYVAILAAWAAGRFGSGWLAQTAPLALMGMALFGVLFSIYLTYLELDVIRAVCIWCLSSAVIMSLIVILATGPAVFAMAGGEEDPEEDQEVEHAMHYEDGR